MLKITFVLFVAVLGLYFVTHYSAKNIENFHDGGGKDAECADLLIQEGKDFFLFNTKLAKVPGVNPLRFNNLEEYVEFVEWQRSQGILCPILYLQHAYDAQNNDVYKARRSPTELQGGLPDQTVDFSRPVLAPEPISTDDRLIDAAHDDLPYNKNSYPSFDPQNQDVGADTPLDKMFTESKDYPSPNPMDTHWGGHPFTHNLVKSGYYSDNEVKIRVA